MWLGAALALTSVGALVYLAGLRRVARFLNAFTDAMEGVQPKPAKQARIVSGKDKNPYGWVKPSSKTEMRNAMDAAEEYREKQEERKAGRARDPKVEAFLSDPDLFGDAPKVTGRVQ